MFNIDLNFLNLIKTLFIDKCKMSMIVIDYKADTYSDCEIDKVLKGKYSENDILIEIPGDVKQDGSIKLKFGCSIVFDEANIKEAKSMRVELTKSKGGLLFVWKVKYEDRVFYTLKKAVYVDEDIIEINSTTDSIH